MEKIRPKVVFVVLALCVSSWVFAEESSSESTKPPQEVENTGEIGPSVVTEDLKSGPADNPTPPVDPPPVPAKVDKVTDTKPPPAPAAKPNTPKSQTPAMPTKYTVTFDADGGEVNPLSENVESGKFVEPPAPTRNGYKFDGWFTEKNGGGEKFESNTKVSENITVHAKWIKVCNTVKFDADGGEVSPLSENVESGKFVEPPTPTRNGYKFDGWFTEKNGGGEKFESNTKVSENITVHAKWTQIVPDILDYNFLLLLAAGVFALVLLALIILNIISIDKINKKIQRLDEEIRKAEKEFNAAEKRYKEDKQKAEQDSRVEPPTRREDIVELKNRHDELRRKVQEMERKWDGLREQKRQQEEVTHGITSRSIDVTEYFNSWAKNPSAPLPHETFYYIEGDMNIRTKCEIKESTTETKWITNRSGGKKYLFPNPNTFSPMTNINELYEMNQAKLKVRGQNKIKIVKPCEMTEDGFVNLPGKLEIL